MKAREFDAETLSEGRIEQLAEMCRLARGDVLKMTTVCGSGHPGGSMSSMEIFGVLYACGGVDPSEPHNLGRDRIVVSHGHTSPGVYAVLGRLGFFGVDDAVATFRKTFSVFEGHVEREVPGVEWSSGNLGQGLSAACGFALAGKLTGADYHVFCAMSDGEQAKGQVVEGMRLARKYDLSNLTVIIDYNQIQISGNLHDVMPQHIREQYEANGWNVVEIDGHDIQQVYGALRQGVTSPGNVCVLANTVIGKGVSFMEGKHVYHGKALSEEECGGALAELGIESDIDAVKERRVSAAVPQNVPGVPAVEVDIDTGEPKTYAADEKTDNRSAFGTALQDIAEINSGRSGATPVVAVDCDLATSVKTNGLAKVTPEAFLQTGVQEHNAATLAGAMSISGVVPFFADFGVFGVDETYNQHRLNDINDANVKLVCTHNGLDVGEDGKTHQCIDYVGVLSNLFGYKVIIPADPNQTDRAVRYVASHVGNFLVAAGRSKLPVITSEEGEPLFAGGYRFEYGAADVVREGPAAAILTAGGMVHRAIAAWEKLAADGIKCLLLNVSCPLGLDADAVEQAAATGAIVTYEDHHVRTGIGSLVANLIAEMGIPAKLKKLGVRSYGRSGVPDDLFKEQGLDPDSLVEAVKTLVS